MCKDNEYVNIKNSEALDESVPLVDNAMLKHSPHLFEEWDFGKNDELGLDVYKVTKGSKKKAWWRCGLGHEWETTIQTRTRGSGCPYCANYKPKILRGYNDLWTTDPETAKLLLNPNDGYVYSKGSGKKVDWKCACGNLILNKAIYTIKENKLPCPRCSDGSSYAEKFIFNVLKMYTNDFVWEKTFDWSNNKRYDFYLPEYNIIIEVHGKQHYEESISSLSGVSLKQEQENDTYKRELALKNGINEYIVIDARRADSTFILKSIYNSNLSKFFDLSRLDIKTLKNKVKSNIHKRIMELHIEGLNKFQISDIVKFKPDTIRKIIRKYRKVI